MCSPSLHHLQGQDLPTQSATCSPDLPRPATPPSGQRREPPLPHTSSCARGPGSLILAFLPSWGTVCSHSFLSAPQCRALHREAAESPPTPPLLPPTLRANINHFLPGTSGFKARFLDDSGLSWHVSAEHSGLKGSPCSWRQQGPPLSEASSLCSCTCW